MLMHIGENLRHIANSPSRLAGKPHSMGIIPLQISKEKPQHQVNHFLGIHPVLAKLQHHIHNQISDCLVLRLVRVFCITSDRIRIFTTILSSVTEILCFNPGGRMQSSLCRIVSRARTSTLQGHKSDLNETALCIPYSLFQLRSHQ